MRLHMPSCMLHATLRRDVLSVSAHMQHVFCPYYASKDRAAAADLIFMPYNYLIDEKIRENYEINYENSVIIFDEAHNVTQA